jgi:raffinose/stachyose/melibiose transport system substrate-binding protein
MKKTLTVLTLLVITALLLAACGGGATTQAPQATQAPVVETQAPVVTEAPQVTEAAAVTEAPAATAAATEAATEAPAAQGGEVTLVVWDQFQREVESGVIDQLDKEFEADHPGVTIQRETKTLDDLKTTLKLALSQSDGPDVAQVNQGRSDMGVWSRPACCR